MPTFQAKAGDENRTRDGSLGSFCFTTKLHPRNRNYYNPNL